MRASDNAPILKIVLRELRDRIAPALQGEEALASLNAVQIALAELLKREVSAPAILQDALREGCAIAQEMAGLAGSPAQFDKQHFLNKLPDHYAGLATRHTELTETLVQLGRELEKHPELSDDRLLLLRKAAEWERQYFQQKLADQPAIDSTGSNATDAGLDADTLAAFLHTVHDDGDAVAVEDFTRIPGGYGKETYRFALRDGADSKEELIVRKSSPEPLLLDQCYLLDKEFALLQAIAKLDFPVPKAKWLAQNFPGANADFCIMEKMPGKVGGSFVTGAESVPESLLLDIASHMAKLHAFDIGHFTDYIMQHDEPAILDVSVREVYRLQIARWRQYMNTREHVPSPLIEYMLQWLESNVPQDSQRPVLVHGDFNIHNCLQVDGRVTAVLDWECSNFGAPEQDIAYISPHIQQHISLDRFIDHYLECGGRPLNKDSFNYYLAFSMFRLAPGVAHGVATLQSGQSQDYRNLMIEMVLAGQVMEMGLKSMS